MRVLRAHDRPRREREHAAKEGRQSIVGSVRGDWTHQLDDDDDDEQV